MQVYIDTISVPVIKMSRAVQWQVLLVALLLSPVAVGPCFGASREKVTFKYVEDIARELAGQPYNPEHGVVPEFVLTLNYDTHQAIEFNSRKALWSGESRPFEIAFTHPGGVYDRAVRINEFSDTHVQEIRFSTDLFYYPGGDEIREKISSSMGYGGFVVRYPINRPEVFEEFAVFAASSYFRVIGSQQRYGLSARALALNTTIPGREEFPLFREYWLNKPHADADSLQVLALLDGASVAGAYEFLLRPGRTTVVKVRATLFFRTEVGQVGLAPFTSMFMHGENTFQQPTPDYRPEVHDSDGLWIVVDDQQHFWRPLLNPPVGSEVSAWHFGQPVMFGLGQRDREFENYQDIVAAYHQRPSAWVVPIDQFGPGQVLLYEFATAFEGVDNVTAFWVPDRRPVPREPYSFAYDLHFGANMPEHRGRVIATRTGQALNTPELVDCVIDFAGEELAQLQEVDGIEARVEGTMRGQVRNIFLKKNMHNNSWRLFLQFPIPESGVPRDLQAYLRRREGEPLTEVWIYRWPVSMK